MDSNVNLVNLQIPPRKLTLAGSLIRRVLPFAKKRTVGPFIFFDHLPATEFEPQTGMNVAPHPHIGLSTLSYLLEGQVYHHDSLGSRQLLLPGDVNWMTAGRGISHSERIPPEVAARKYRMELLQFWVALPLAMEDCDPRFTHHEKSTIPQHSLPGIDVRIVAGEAYGKKSPVDVFSPLFFLDVHAKKGSTFEFTPKENHETAFYLLHGSLGFDEKTCASEDFFVLQSGASLRLEIAEDSRFVVLGGEPFPEPRHIYWNFVSSSKEKIEAAKKLWKSGEFPQVPGETDIIPLPVE